MSSKLFRRLALSALLVSSGTALAAPTIRQKYWIVLGPIQNSGDFWGEMGDPNPTPGHDLLGELPRAGDDWGGGEIPFISGAPTSWQDLSRGVPPFFNSPDFQCLCWDLLYGRDLGLALPIDRVKAVAVTYVENRTGSSAEIRVCTGDYNEEVKVWINRDLVANVVVADASYGCRSMDPALLPPGKSKLTVVSCNGLGPAPWSGGISLLRNDGTPIDDASDPSFTISSDPTGGLEPPAASIRTISRQCSSAGTQVTIRGPGGGDPAGLVHVFEEVEGPAAVTGISHGGTLTPATHDFSFSCSGALHPAGEFTDTRDVGGPCSAGSTAFDPAGGVYSLRAGGSDIWNGGDQFQFAYLKARGDFSISARIAYRSFDGGAPPARGGQFGVMVRQDCSGSSRYSAVLDYSKDIDGTDPDGYAFKTRTVHGRPASSFDIAGAGEIHHPEYVRLDREGSKLIGYASMDRASWVTVGEYDWGADAPCELLLGLVVCSRAGCPQIEIHFDSVEIAGGDGACGGRIDWNVQPQALATGLSYTIGNPHGGVPGIVKLWGADGSGLIAGPRDVDLGRTDQAQPGPDFGRAIDVGGAQGGSTAFDLAGKVYTVISSGATLSDEGDRFHFACQEMTGDFDLSIEILQAVEPPGDMSPAGRFGLMARKDCLGDSKHCTITRPSGDSNGQVPALIYRLIHGTHLSTVGPDQSNATQFDYSDVGQRPRFQRLVRLGNTFYAFLSRDGAKWDPIGRDTWHGQDPAEPVLVGFAAASGRNFRTGESPPTTVRFRVLEWEPLHLPAPFAEDDLPAAEILLEEPFDGDALDPARWSAQAGDNGFKPHIRPENHRLQLTHDEFCCPHVTAAFARAPVIDDIDGLTYLFDFDAYLTNPADNAADGFTFTVVSGDDTSRLGQGGPGMGYEGLNRRIAQNGTANSFAVEFDASSACCEWNGGLGSPQSPGRWHLGIDSGNLALSSHVFTSDLPDIYDPLGIHCLVRYSRGLVQVWVTSNGAVPGDQPPGPRLPAIEARVLPLSFAAPDRRAVFGFTAGTGGTKVVAEVDNLRVLSVPEPPVDAAIAVDARPNLGVGDVVTLDGRGSRVSGGSISYSWRVLSGPADLEGPDDGPIAALRVSGTGAPIVVALTVDDGLGEPPLELPPLESLSLCTPECPLPGHCVTCLRPPFEGTCIAVICPPLPDPALPGPQEIEATLAEGTARFEWSNPVQYDRIRVLGPSGALIQELPGDSRVLEIPSLGQSEVAVFLWGVDITGDLSAPGRGLARILDCQRRPPLTPVGEKGDLELTLYGGYPPAIPADCAVLPPGGIGGGAGEEAPEGGHGAGFDFAAPGIGFVRTNFDLEAPFFPPLPSALTTGFTLDRDADKLEIAAHYRKIFNGPGVELRALLRRVGPDHQRDYYDEFTFPDVFVSDGAERQSMIYFRADSDIGKPDAQPCNLVIPAGDYLLDFYAVGGNSRFAYFGFPDDKRDSEVLVPGAPCPPYPLVEVTDLSGIPTLPTVNKVTGVLQEGCIPRLRIKFTAEGFWSDGSAVFPTSKPNPDFEYFWKIHDKGGQPEEKSSFSSNSIAVCLQDLGCFVVELRIRSRSCPLEKKVQFEVPVFPDEITCPTPTFLFPTPAPEGIYAVVGLNMPEVTRKGSFEPRGNLEFRVLAVPCCEGASNPSSCPSLSREAVEFRLSGRVVVTTVVTIATPILPIEDLCNNVNFGPKYFKVTFQDPGTLADLGFLADYPRFLSVNLDARIKGTAFWQRVGQPMHFTNHPKCLEDALWTGHFEEKEGAYKFLVKMAEGFEAGKPIGSTEEIKLPGLPVTIPSFDNDVTSGFTSRFEMAKSVWKAVPGAANLSGEVLSNEISGAQTALAGQVKQLRDEALGQVFDTYVWCKDIPIFNRALEQKLFEAILYTGTVGPIPVTVWASIALGLQFNVNAQVNVEVSPFARLLDQGRNFVRAFVTVRSGVNIYVPCEIRADILFGIASLAARLIPEANFALNTQVGAIDDEPIVRAAVNATIALYFEVKACLNFLITEICFSPGRIQILSPRSLIPGAPADVLETLPSCPPSGAGAAGPEEVLDLPLGRGAGVRQLHYMTSTSTPATAASPDRRTLIDTWVTEDEFVQLFVKVDGVRMNVLGTDTSAVPGFSVRGKFRDPSIAFISNDRAVIAWSRSFTEDVHGVDPTTLAGMNRLAQEDEILITSLEKVDAATWRIPFIYRVHDRSDQIPDTANWRADGKAALAGDPVHGEALAAWVRYETSDFLIDDGTKTLPVPRQNPDGTTTIVDESVTNRRPQIERTAIYSRSVGFSGVLGAPEKVSPAGTGINIEPAIAVSPTGDAAYCVWVHDSSPGHVNLVDSNRGRKLLYAVRSRATGVWSPPADVYPLARFDLLYPGVLEPKIVLKGDSRGLLAFTALGENAPERDSGLGGNRSVYAARLENGVFQDPVLIHGKCLKRLYGADVYIEVPKNPLRDKDGNIVRPPEYVLAWQGTDPALGSAESSGDVMAASLGDGMVDWSPPVSVTPDESIHSNIAVTVAGGAVHSINLNGGPASLDLRAGLGAGAGLEPESSFEVIDTLLEADAAVTGCSLTNQFAAPGAMVTASVAVENLGLMNTPVDEQGRSVLRVVAVFLRENGDETLVAAEPIDEIVPGAIAMVPMAIEMPLQPVRLRVRLEGASSDSDPTNNSRECFLGAPSPRDVGCEPIDLNDEAGSRATRITWTTPALYDEICLYRDGSMFATTSGVATSFIDVYAAPGEHTYCVRGRIGVSKSAKAVCQSIVPRPPFRRGDSDGNGAVNITDAVRILNVLFLGIGTISCDDAADSDDNGSVNITDAVRILNVLFIGLGTIPAPGTDSCGLDPTDDGLAACSYEC